MKISIFAILALFAVMASSQSLIDCGGCQYITSTFPLQPVYDTSVPPNLLVPSIGMVLTENLVGAGLIPSVVSGLVDGIVNTMTNSFATNLVAYCNAAGFCPNLPTEPAVPISQIVTLTSNIKVTQFPPPRGNEDLILVLPDIHVDENYDIGTVSEDCGMDSCCNAMDGTTSIDPAGKFGSFQCGTPQITLVSLLKFYKKQLNNQHTLGRLTKIVLLGDMTPLDYYAETQQSTIDACTYVRNKVAQYFPGIPLVIVVGNHEPQFIGQVLETGDWLYPAMLQIFQDQFTREQANDFLKGGYYMTGSDIVLNNQLGDYTNFQTASAVATGPNPPDTDFGGQLAWFATKLAYAKREHMKVRIWHHIPWNGQDQRPEYVEQIRILMEQYADTIECDIAGHLHAQFLSVMRDKATNSIPLIPLMSVASVTANGNVNPAITVMHFAPMNGAPWAGQWLDYDHYQLELDESNAANQPIIYFNYTGLSRYGMVAMNANDIQDRNNRAFTDTNLHNLMTWDYQSQYFSDDFPVERLMCYSDTSRPDQMAGCTLDLGTPVPPLHDDYPPWWWLCLHGNCKHRIPSFVPKH
jgi:hypothetical protein